MPARQGTPPTTIRHIDTAGLPDGFDVADLIAGGTTGAALVAWCRDRLRPGYPVAEGPQKVKAPGGEGIATEGGRSKGETDEGRAQGATTRTRPSTPRLDELEPPQAPPPVAAVAGGQVVPLPVARPQAPPASDEAMLPPEYSHDSLAREFTRQFAGTYLYVGTWGRWLGWDGGRWAHDETNRVGHSIRLVLREQANDILDRIHEFKSKTRAMASTVASIGSLTAVERLCRADPRHAAAPAQFDADDWALNTPGGIVNLRSGEIRPALVADYCTKITRATPGGECPNWLAFLDSVTGGDTELQSYLQRMVGYALTGSTREHAFFFFFGTGRNGKGTFLNTLEWLLGSYAKVASMDTFTESKQERHTTELASLMGARMVTAQETDEGKRWAEGRLKSLTGGDPITARFIAKDEFTFIPQMKLMFSGNHRPALKNIDEAMKARLHMVPFTVTVPPEKRDGALPDKLRAEAGGILAWAIEGCLAWQREGLRRPKSVRLATDEYFDSQDMVRQWITDQCVIDDFAREAAPVLYRSFERYCREAGEYVMTRRRWADALELKGFRRSRNTTARMIGGLRLRTDLDRRLADTDEGDAPL